MILIGTGRVVGCVGGAVALLIWGVQERLMYFPSAYRAREVDDFFQAGGCELLYQTSSGGQTAFYLPPREGGGGLPERLWIVCAGNGSRALDWWPVIERWNPRFGWMFLDYPGYGRCEGNPDPARIRENALEAIGTLARHLGATPGDLASRLGVLGHSLGSAAALLAAEAVPVRRIVLVAPFTTMTDMAQRVVGWPLCLLNRHRYDNRARLDSLERLGARIHLFHGSDDEVIPVAMGRELAAAHPDMITFHEIRSATHMGVIDEAAEEIHDALEALAQIE
jgi:uncharacterized protein